MAKKRKPYEQLKVFISSAMAPEKGVQWLDIRSKISCKLDSSVYICPFTIEDYANEAPSTQVFQFQVKNADIVVLLVNGELRKGVQQEYSVIKKENKSVLVYSLENDNPDIEVVRFLAELRNNDFCTYKTIKTLDGIETIIYDHLIQNVIAQYKMQKSIQQSAPTSIVEVFQDFENEPFNNTVHTSSTFDLFKSCHNTLLKMLGRHHSIFKDKTIEKSELHDIGSSVLHWVMNGGKICDDKHILKLLDLCQSIYGERDWLSKRWDAIRRMSQNLAKEAFEDEKNALAICKVNKKIPQWLISNILIDCRNFENSIGNIERSYSFEYQKAIDESDAIIYLPGSDRYECNALNKILDDEIARSTSSPYTTHLGSSLDLALESIENQLFCAIIYGSYTQIVITRKLLIKVLFSYGMLLHDRALVLEAIKLCVLNGDVKLFKGIVNTKWDFIHTDIITNVNEIWDISNYCAIDQKSQMQYTIIDELGLYFTDDYFKTIQHYLSEQLETLYWGHAESYLKAILSMHRRLPEEEIVVILTKIIRENRFHIASTISRIILQMDISNVDRLLLDDFCSAIVENYEYFLKSNGDPQIVAALINQQPDIFQPLKNHPLNQLSGLQKIKFDINIGVGSWLSLLEEELKIAREQFEANKNPMRFSGFAEQPYQVIRSIIKDNFDDEYLHLFNEVFFPLCKDVFSSEAPLSIKENCLMCLIELAAVQKVQVSFIEEIKNIIRNLDVIDEGATDLFYRGTSQTWLYRVLLIRTICGIDTKKDILYHYFSYSSANTNERLILAECILSYLAFCVSTRKNIDDIFLAMAISLSDDVYYHVRIYSCRCFIELLQVEQSEVREIVVERINRFASDSSPFVRFELLRQCDTSKLEVNGLNIQLASYLCDDANYAVRESAKDMIRKHS